MKFHTDLCVFSSYVSYSVVLLYLFDCGYVTRPSLSSHETVSYFIHPPKQNTYAEDLGPTPKLNKIIIQFPKWKYFTTAGFVTLMHPVMHYE